MAKFIRPRRVRRKKLGVSIKKSEYDEKMLLTAVDELQSGKIKLERMRYNDDVVPGLRFVMNPSGLVTFHIQYGVGKERKYLLLGSLNKERDDHISIEEARELAETVKGLAEHGIDPAEGLHRRLIRELKRDGLDWSPYGPGEKVTLRRRKA